MIMTDEVRKALQTLRDNATNDFERHRIDVLERDLTEPPKVEIVDDKHQRFLGINFRKNSKGYYFPNSLSLHQFVYGYFNETLPNGCDIHHDDHNKDNNDASNLIPLTKYEHGKVHGQVWHNQAKAERKAERMSKPYHGSGIRDCTVCGRPYYYDARNSKRLTCSSECEKALRKSKNKSRRADRSKTCVVCGKPFEYKHSHKNQKACSPKCGRILSQRTLQQSRQQ